MNSDIKKNDSIAIKLCYLAVIPILIISMLLGAYFIYSSIQDVRENLLHKGNLIAGNLGPSVGFGLFSQDIKFLKTLTEPLLSDDDVVSVLILDKTRTPVVASISSEYSASQLLDESSENQIFESAVYTTRFDSEDFKLDELVNKQAIESVQEPELMGWVVVKLSNHSSQQRQMEIIINVLFIIILGVVISGLIAYQLAKRIACPIMGLTDTVKEISNGNLSARSEINGVGELQYLQLGVNAMAEIVQGSQHKLEQEVLEATQQLTDTIAELEEKNTRLNSTKTELHSANAAKSEFLAKMSHEIRTPLTAVMGFSRLIETAEVKEDIEAYTRIINRSGVQLLNIIDDILSFSKLDDAKQLLMTENINIRDTMDDVISMLSPSAKVKRIPLVVQVSNEVPVYLQGDAVKLSQIVINLVGNAIKFTESGFVHVNLRLMDSSDENVVIEVEVIDTGVGVATEASDKIFDRFSQVESDKDRSFEGVGLGLAISKKLIGLMGGQIGLDNSVKIGSRFWFNVPLKLSTKTDAVNSLKTFKQTIVLYDRFNVSRLAMSQTLLRWKADLYVCEKTSEMLDVLVDPEINVDRILISLDFQESSIDVVVNIVKQVRLRFSGQIILLSSDHSEGIRDAVESVEAVSPPHKIMKDNVSLKAQSVHPVSSTLNVTQIPLFTVLEKPVPHQRLHDSLFSCNRVKELNRMKDDDFSNKSELDAGETQRLKLLVAEDNEYNSKLIAELFMERGIGCVCVENAEGVLAKIKKEKYDLLLLDIHMPGMDGLTLASEIRNNHLINEKTPIVAFTADVYIRNDQKLKSRGINDVLYKPLSDDSLDKMLDTWLAGYHYNPVVSDACVKELPEGASQRLFDDVLAHLNNIERSYSFNDTAALNMHLHQLKGVLGYFNFDDILDELNLLEAHVYALNDDKFQESLTHLNELVQNVIADD